MIYLKSVVLDFVEFLMDKPVDNGRVVIDIDEGLYEGSSSSSLSEDSNTQSDDAFVVWKKSKWKNMVLEHAKHFL